MNAKKIIIGLAAVCTLAFATDATAGLQSQVDSSTNVLQALSTNIYALYGDITGNYTNGATLNPNSFIDFSKTDLGSFSVGGYFANTGGQSNVMFQVYQTTDLKLWQLATNLIVTVPAASTNWQWTSWTVSQGGIGNGPQAAYALRAVINTNTLITTPGIGSATNSGSLFLKCYTRTGI